MIDSIVAKGFLPDFALRRGIRHLIDKRLDEILFGKADQLDQRRRDLVNELSESPIALETDLANDQHYQVPSAFFEKVLGENLKYSCAYWPEGTSSLVDAENRMLELTCERAEIVDGMSILELGCGWGAITLFMAKKYPNSKIVAISNSKTQKIHIESRCEKEGVTNVEVRTCNVAELELSETFDRVVSVEMFEHMRNYKKLLSNISRWLNENGKLFVHVFVHSKMPYKFEVKDESDWMSRYFFSGGIMPSEHLFYYFQDDLKISRHWSFSGEHYAKTARAWLNKMDENKEEIYQIFNEHYGKKEATKWFNYWRVFFMSCEELWAFNRGREWLIGHYLFEK
ncbi:cyclopropane-fatty-acyl-phospholipid synthase [Halobacteriovorax sp. GB3]|uniref:SAM-dependent methyltransferase n=1 Tax=Halobacteriovorax sp. GB3 TaxID=2719615 RepID=UPI00235DDA23|nr:cyclopropane-fatty-acyl-phospholipid synthase family protein [Halobacteriovorax sp. GB3]MDD0851496.1 cyclopropane-fatty-acyl-phospholipid synthase [Halobacteriovorax sp. GB3]